MFNIITFRFEFYIISITLLLLKGNNIIIQALIDIKAFSNFIDIALIARLYYIRDNIFYSVVKDTKGRILIIVIGISAYEST